MKKIYFVLIFVIVCAFLFTACEQTDVSESGSEFTTLPGTSRGNDDDQGEDEGNGKKPPVVVPPQDEPPEDNVDGATVSIRIIPGPVSEPEGGGRYADASADIIVMLTLSEGSWDSFLYPWVSNDPFAAEKSRLTQWFTITPVPKYLSLNTATTAIESGVEYIKIKIDDRFGANKTTNPKVLSFKIPTVSTDWKVWKDWEDWSDIPTFTVTINEEKLDEIKAATNVSGNLTVGVKSAILEVYENSDPELSQSIPYQVGIALNHMNSTQGHELLTIVQSQEELNHIVETRYFSRWDSRVFYLVEHTEKYDDAFFAENALVVFLFRSSSGGGIFDITDMVRQGDELKITADYRPGMLTVISYWTVILEVTQADVNGITSLVVNK